MSDSEDFDVGEEHFLEDDSEEMEEEELGDMLGGLARILQVNPAVLENLDPQMFQHLQQQMGALLNNGGAAAAAAVTPLASRATQVRLSRTDAAAFLQSFSLRARPEAEEESVAAAAAAGGGGRQEALSRLAERGDAAWCSVEEGSVEEVVRSGARHFEATGFAVFLAWLMCRGSPAQLLQRLQQEGKVKSKNCTVTWSLNDYCYHCKDCEVDPSCAFCVDCFQEELHEGHDYHLTRAGGGCCDCGDTTAWNPDTFCDRHRSTAKSAAALSAAEVEALLSKPVVHWSRLVLGEVSRLLDRLADEVMQKQEEAGRGGVGHSAQCLISLCDLLVALPSHFGDSFRTLVSEALLGGGLVSKLSQVMRPARCVAAVHDLFFQLLPDPSFKLALGAYMANSYTALVDAAYDARHSRSDTIVEFSVQLLTSPEVAPVLVREHAMMRTMLSVCLRELRKAAVTPEAGDEASAPFPVLSGSHAALKRPNVLIRAIIDLSYLFFQPAVDRHISGSEEELSQLVAVFGALQGGNAIRRKTGEHVMYPPQGYRKIFSYESDWYERSAGWFKSLKYGAASIPDAFTWSDELGDGDAPDAAANAALFSTIVRSVWSALQSWLRVAHPTLRRDPGSSFTAVAFDDTQQWTTTNLPLHRMLARVLSSASRWHDLSPMQLLAECAVDDLVRLAEDPLRVMNLVNGADVGLWKRNGETAMYMSWFYRASFFYNYTIDYDVYLLQCVACMIPARHFVSICVDKFALQPWLVQVRRAVASGNGKLTVDEAWTRRAEGLLRTLMWVLTDRCGMGTLTEEELVKRDLIHFLATGVSKHSELLKLLPEELENHPQLHEWLNDVADFQEAKDGKDGGFRLKDESWLHYDPYFSHYEAQQRQLAEEQYQYFMSHSKQVPQGLKLAPAPLPKVAPTSPHLQRLLALCQEHSLWSLCEGVICSAVQKPTESLSSGEAPEPPLVTETVALMTLDLLYVCATCCLRLQADAFTAFLCNGESGVLGALLRMQREDALRVYRAGAGAVLGLLTSEQRVADTIRALREQEAGENEQTVESAEERRARKRAAAKERQRKIKEAMLAKRNAFMAKQNITLDGDDDEDAEGAGGSAAVPQCVLCHENTQEEANPMCWLGLLQRTSVLSLSPVFGSDGEPAALKKRKTSEEEEEKALLPADEDTIETLLQKAVERTRRALFRDLDGHEQANMRICGHAMHLTCYQNYFASQRAARVSGVVHRAGEYLCPLCSLLANTVIPLSEVPRGQTSMQAAARDTSDSEGAAFSTWFAERSRVCKGAQLSQQGMTRGAQPALSTFRDHLHTLMLGYPLPVAANVFVWNALAACVAQVEQLRRGGEEALLGKASGATRRTLDALTVVVPSVARDGELHGYMWQQLVEGDAALRRCDMFSYLVRLVLSWEGEAVPVQHLLDTCFAAHLVQVCAGQLEEWEKRVGRVQVFLRRAALFLHAVGLLGEGKHEEDGGNLLDMLHLDAGEVLGRKALQEVLGRWCAVVRESSAVMPPVLKNEAVQLVQLPHMLQEKQWFTEMVNRECSKCGRVPRNPVLCLLCGFFACRAEGCCRFAEGVGECTWHAQQAHAGCCVWLDVKRADTVCLRPGSGCFYNSVYLDRHGEEDSGLTRGRPVYLNAQRYESLRRAVLSCGVVDLTVKKSQRLVTGTWDRF